jgi:very-short-patch-repair endonuclease
MDTREKSIQLFTYLRELSALRSKQVKDIKKYEQILWLSEIPKEKGCYCVAWNLWAQTDDEKEERSHVWIEVRKPTLKSPPEVPDDLEPWIKEEEVYDSSLEEPSVFEEIVVSIEPEDQINEKLTDVLSIDDHPEIFDIWIEYVEHKWKPWAEEDRRLQRIQRVYNDLFTIYQKAEKLGEQYEVVIGIGFLLWRSPNSGEIRHPILTFQCQIEFDRVRGIISIVPPLDGPQPKLETDMLETSDRPEVTDLQAIMQMVDELSDEPWDGKTIEAILKSFANGISTESQYQNNIERPSKILDSPQLNFAPTLILRKRTRRTFVDYYQQICGQLAEGTELPESVRRLVEIVEDEKFLGDRTPDQPSSRVSISDTELYFPLRANDEQKRIAKTIEHQRGVLVQGPPGTGKSHTITNLISHFLAKGQRVLVTSETPRALEVLKRMLPEEIRELCVMWLGAGPEAQKSLGKSVNGITQQKVNWNSTQVLNKLSELEKRLDEVRREKASLWKELIAFRQADTYQHSNVFGTYTGTLESIAIRLNKEKSKFGWLLDRPHAEKEPRVTPDELVEMLRNHRKITQELLREIKLRHLPKEKLIRPAEFKNLVYREKRALAQYQGSIEKRNYPGYKALWELSPDKRVQMLGLLKSLVSRIDQLSKNVHAWADRAASEIAADQDRVWRQLLEFTEENLQVLQVRIREVSTLKISGLEGYDQAELALHAQELKAHLDNGKGLGVGPFRPKPVKQGLYLVKKIYVDGQPCKTATVLEKLINWLDFKKRLEGLAELWKEYTTPPQGTFAVQLAAYQDLCEPLREAIEIHGFVKKLKELISLLPELGSPHWHLREDVEALRDALEACIVEEELRIARKAFKPMEFMILDHINKGDSHPAAQQALRALQKRDTKAYEEAYQAISRMYEWVQKYKALRNIYSRFNGSAPKTAEIYKASVLNESWESRFSQFEAAWIWAKTDRWLSDMCDKNRSKQLSKALEQKQKDELGILRKLAAHKAWQHCMDKLGEIERQALIAWKQAVERIGFGYGRRVEFHRETARQKLQECRKAIPAWVMPLYQVVQTTIPHPGIFDVVIVDEASQSGPEALLLNFIGKKIVVVGDNKQITPLHIGVDRDQVEYLRRMYIQEIPHSQALDLESSLFSLAELRFPDRVRLREHFRCMPEIIQFSNKLSYSTEPLIPLRQYGADRLEPVIANHVKDGYRKGRSPNIINEPEARAIVEQIVECCEDPTYDNKTFGVISLLGGAQSTHIGNLLVKELGAEEIENRQLLSGNPYDFQGDERDVIFLSMVDAPANGRVCRMVRDAETQRRFNVAASRARDQLWLFHTPTLNDLRPGCLRYRLLEYCLNPSVVQDSVGGIDIENLRHLAHSEVRERTSAPESFDSWFEVDVFLKIVDQGYRVLPQYEVAGFKIDLVVEGLKGRLAVECDGDEWHGLDRIHDDLKRQLLLERCGWTFWRCRGSDYYRDSQTALASLWVKLENLAIYPEKQWEEERRKSEEEAVETEREQVFGEEEDKADEAPIMTESGEMESAEALDLIERVEIKADDFEHEKIEGRLDRALEYSRKLVKRPENLSARSIQHAIIEALDGCPNQTCTAKSITSRVLKKLGVITRGNPRIEFDRRVKRNVGVLKRKRIVEEYKAKNKRLRLLQNGSQLPLFGLIQKTHEKPVKSEKRKSPNASIQKVADRSTVGIDPTTLIDPIPNMLHYLLPDTDRKCENCGTTCQILVGPYGPYLKCPSRKCKKTKGINFSILKKLFDILQIPCRKCGSAMTVAKGYKGSPFPGCGMYPDCKTPEQWKELIERIKQKNVRRQLGANK